MRRHASATASPLHFPIRSFRHTGTLLPSGLTGREVEKEVVDVSKELLLKNPDIGAFLFECSDIPTFSKATSEATGLPVFDFISFAHLVYSGLMPRCYSEML